MDRLHADSYDVTISNHTISTNETTQELAHNLSIKMTLIYIGWNQNSKQREHGTVFI